MATLEGLIIYIFISAITLAAGIGILQIIGLSLSNRSQVFLSPLLTLCFWTLYLGIGVLFGYSVRQLWPLGWSVTAVLGTWAFWKGLHWKILREWKGIGICFLLPILVMLPNFWYGLKIYLGSNLPDGWSYIAYGQYLWEYPRGTEGGLAPLYQYAAHLNRTRFISSAMLAFFTPLSGNVGDTQMTMGLFQAWTLFVFGTTCLFWAQQREEKEGYLLIFVIFTVFSGWILRLLWANNLDNALAISFLPGLAGTLQIMNEKIHYLNILISAMLAASIYSYPEMSPFIIVGTSFFFLHRFLLEKKKKTWIHSLLFSVTLIIILIFPFFDDFILFLKGQIHVSLQNTSIRPGEGYFPELLNPGHQLYSWWGFGTGSIGGLILHFSLGAVLTLCAIIGLWKMKKNDEWGFLANFVFLLLVGTIITFYFHYSYGAYKVFLLLWWALAFLVVSGIKMLLQRYQGRELSFAVGIFFLLMSMVHIAKIDPFSNEKSQNLIIKYKELELIKPIIQQDSIYVGIEDDLANQWAVFFLRDKLIHLCPYRSYMAQKHVIPFMRRSRLVDKTKIIWVLADENKNDLLRSGIIYRRIWQGTIYSLFQIEPSSIEPVIRAYWAGFGDLDFVSMSETPGPDGKMDAIFHLDISSPGEITAIEMRNIGGKHSIWDTIPGNGHLLIGVAETPSPFSLLNRPDGSVLISIRASMRLFLYVADNSSIKEGNTKYQLTIYFSDGRAATAVIQGRG